MRKNVITEEIPVGHVVRHGAIRAVRVGIGKFHKIGRFLNCKNLANFTLKIDRMKEANTGRIDSLPPRNFTGTSVISPSKNGSWIGIDPNNGTSWESNGDKI